MEWKIIEDLKQARELDWCEVLSQLMNRGRALLFFQIENIFGALALRCELKLRLRSKAFLYNSMHFVAIISQSTHIK